MLVTAALLLLAQADSSAAAAAAAREGAARERALAFADALETGAPLPGMAPTTKLETLTNRPFDVQDVDAARLRSLLAGCRKGEMWADAPGPYSEQVAIRYHCPRGAHRPHGRLILRRMVLGGPLRHVRLEMGPLALERRRAGDRSRAVAPDASFADDRAAVSGLLAAIQAGQARLPHASPTLALAYDDETDGRGRSPLDPAGLRKALAGCRPGPVDAEPRRWLGLRQATVPFACPATHKPHPEMAAVVALIDGRVEELWLLGGPPQPLATVSPAPAPPAPPPPPPLPEPGGPYRALGKSPQIVLGRQARGFLGREVQEGADKVVEMLSVFEPAPAVSASGHSHARLWLRVSCSSGRVEMMALTVYGPDDAAVRGIGGRVPFFVWPAPGIDKRIGFDTALVQRRTCEARRREGFATALQAVRSIRR